MTNQLHRDDPLIRQTHFGQIQGDADRQGTTWIWKQIPFAKAPIGDLRWKAPQDPEPWSGVQMACDECQPAMQLEGTPGWLSLPSCVGSEDCLYLKIYRPQTAEILPVYFWIHGGANVSGEAAAHDMALLAQKANMVVVVIQYRMSAFGYFTHPALREQLEPVAASGNLGTLDQIKALEWVRDNIAFFDGDPDNVTIAGESAGGHNVMAMVISPLAKGLFHKAVMQSGGMVSQSVATTDKIANQTINRALVMRGLAADMKSASETRTQMSHKALADFLYNLSAEELMQAHAGGPGGVQVPLGNLTEDGYVIPGPLLALIESGQYNKVPIIAGSNAHESGSINTLLPALYSEMPCYSDLLQVVAGEKSLDEALPTAQDKAGWTLSRNYGSRFWRTFMVDELLKRMRLHQDDLYAYNFLWGDERVRPGPVGFIYGAAHALEIVFMHGNADNPDAISIEDALIHAGFTPENRAGRQALSDAMVAYLAAFAHTGNPNSASELPVWLPWSREEDGPKVLKFDADLDQALIDMDSEELSMAGVRAELSQEALDVQEHVKVVLSAMTPYWVVL